MTTEVILTATQTTSDPFYVPTGGPHLISMQGYGSGTWQLEYCWIDRDPDVAANWVWEGSVEFTSDGIARFSATPDLRFRLTGGDAGPTARLSPASPPNPDRIPDPPSEPTALAAAVATTEVVLTWGAPDDDGGTAIEEYEYRSAEAGMDLPATWTSAALALTATVASLTDDTEYVFEVRAAQWAGNGPAAQISATPTA